MISMGIHDLGGLTMGGEAWAPAEDEPNPNLLLWSEQFQQAAWTKTNATVTADVGADPLGGTTADQIAFLAGGAVRQVTAVAAASGVAVTATIATNDERPSATGTFDGTVYVFSVHPEPVGGAADIRLRIDRSGGFLRVSIEDAGDEATMTVWGAKLETPDLTAYVKREGV